MIYKTLHGIGEWVDSGTGALEWIEDVPIDAGCDPFSIWTGGVPCASSTPIVSDQIVVPVGSTQQTIDRVIDAAITNPNAKITLPAGFSQSQINNILEKLATFGGRWIAQTFGSNTLLTRDPQGGISTFNLQKAMPWIIGGIALFVLSGKR